MGLGYALATTTLLVSIIKWVVGGLRPHFLSVCVPRIPSIVPGVATLGPSYYTASKICTGAPHRVKEAQMSFPSGHASAAFAGFGFLALYLNAKNNVFAHRANGKRISHWKLVMFVLPWLIAVLIAASKIRDGWHHPVDVIFGALIGTALAHLAFKMVFRSVYDWRNNHVPME
jgi:diacylglycerol diphosphate phosphatase/phosphatidate phosphatase